MPREPRLVETPALRSARLLFSEELAGGRLAVADIQRPDVLRELVPRPFASKAVRYGQRLQMKRRPRWFEDHGIAPLVKAREAVLGAEARTPPRFIVRVDEYPLAGAYDDRSPRLRDGFERFHTTLMDAGVPYLMAVCPAVSRDYLDPRDGGTRPLSDTELATLQRLRDDGVEFALHGFDHRTRDARPRRHSELAGLDPIALADLVDRGLERLGEAGLEARVFVPPFNRFDPEHYEVLATHFEAVGGGPESVARLGFHRTPLVRGDAAYVPAYAPFYGGAAEMAEAVRSSIGAGHGVWLPVVMHWSWELGRWDELERLAAALAGHTRSWAHLLDAAAPEPDPLFVADLARPHEAAAAGLAPLPEALERP